MKNRTFVIDVLMPFMMIWVGACLTAAFLYVGFTEFWPILALVPPGIVGSVAWVSILRDNWREHYG